MANGLLDTRCNQICLLQSCHRRTDSELSPLYGVSAPADWVFGNSLSTLPLCPQRIATFVNSNPSREHPGGSGSFQGLLMPKGSDTFHPNSITAPSLITRSPFPKTPSLLGPTFAVENFPIFFSRQSRTSLVEGLNFQA